MTWRWQVCSSHVILARCGLACRWETHKKLTTTLFSKLNRTPICVWCIIL